MKFLLSSLVFILMSQVASAQSAFHLLQRDISGGIKNFSRETRLYHYFVMNTETDRNGKKVLDRRLVNDEKRAEWLNRLVALRAGAFWDLNNHNTVKVNAGPGLYLALDPSSSREYGDTMLLLDIPAGSKYISTVKPISLKADTLQALVSENIITADQLKVSENTLGLEAGLTMEALKNMVLPENMKFRVIMHYIFKNLDIQMIEYGYKSHQNGFCKGGRLTAIVFVGSKTLDDSAREVEAVINPEFRKQFLAADYLVGVFQGAMNSVVDLTMRYRDAITEIRTTAFDAPKVVNWPKALGIIEKHLSPEETAYLRETSFECKTP